MSTATFDTHSCYKRLTDSGVTPGAAEAQLSVMSGWIAAQDLRAATKQDLAEVSRELRSEMKLEVSQLKAQLVWYMLAFALAQVALEVGLVHALR
ncbi:hypothetical protein [Caballeronia mineralivorans]|uniref:hypothetical protein n=1 Tax=Caballeronia mineralivorans TaxID=2010198 RepID=UPI002AFFBD45|nr:hypothetical protein [Caballeronia mineralivorans]MEA3097387.1 hypothetical protein [Caballeronia mineralivorans]